MDGKKNEKGSEQGTGLNKSRYIAVDLGAESGRFIVGELEGDKLKISELYRFNTGGTLIHGQLRWNVVRFWEEILEGLKRYRREYGPDANGIGIDSWGVSPVFLDEFDQLAFIPFHYRADLVAPPMLSRFKEELGEYFVFKKTGIQFLALNTSVQLFSIEKKYPGLLSRVKTVFLIPDYFYYLLTGKKITEYTNASTTQLLNVEKRDWDGELISKLGPNLKRALFPELHPTGTRLGSLLSEVRELTGVGDIPVHVVATHDTGSAIAAIPHTDKDTTWAYLSSGTWSLLGVELDHPVVNDNIHTYNLTNEGGVDGTIRLLKNIMGLWLIQECRRKWNADGLNLDYAKITELSKEAEPFKYVIHPDHPRFFAPKSMLKEISAACSETGQSSPETPGEYARTIFESLACRYREVIEMLEEVIGQKIKQIHIVGGGSKNRVLSQMTADCTVKTVICGPVEATAIGNLLMQARSDGKVRDLNHLREVVANSFPIETITPDPSKKSDWDEFYSKYRKLYEKIRS